MNKIEIPSTCPECAGNVELINDQLYCINPNCSAKNIKSLLNFIKTMKIMGLGEKTVEKLKIYSIFDIYSLEKESIISIMGEKIGNKLYLEITKSKHTTIQKFVSALGIPLIGKTAAEKIQSKVSSVDEITKDTCKQAGLGPKATENIIQWKDENWTEYSSLPFIFENTEPVSSGLLVCISGKVPGYTKAKIKEMLLDYNVSVKDSVTKDIDYLVTNESGTTKVKKAEQYNINIISFESFMEKLNNE